MHLLIAALLPYASFGVTFALWGLIGVTVMAPVRLATALYQSSRINGKYHFRARYKLRREQYQKEVRASVFALTCIVAMLFAFSILSHKQAVINVSDTIVWEVIKLISLVKNIF